MVFVKRSGCARGVALTTLLALASACGGNDGGNGDGGVRDGALDGRASLDGSNNNGDGSNGNGDGSNTGSDGAVDDAICASASIPVQGVPPNVLIVFDRSGSMRFDLDGTDNWQNGERDPSRPNNRWNIAVEAVRRATSTYNGRVRWGIEMFPSPIGESPATCEPGGVDPPQVMPQANGGPAVMTELGLPRTVDWDNRGSGTPTARALAVARMRGGLQDAARNNFVMLVTDGQATCSSDSTRRQQLVDEVNALRMLPIPVKTAVVGLSAQVNTGDLDAMARAGGMPRPGDVPHYSARDAASLNQALEQIAAAALSCTFRLEQQPMDPSRIFVALDGEQVSRDPSHAMGWDYDGASNTVTLYGATCDRLRNGMVRQVNVSSGCRANTTCVPTTEWCDGIDNDCDNVVDGPECVPPPG